MVRLWNENQRYFQFLLWCNTILLCIHSFVELLFPSYKWQLVNYLAGVHVGGGGERLGKACPRQHFTYLCHWTNPITCKSEQRLLTVFYFVYTINMWAMISFFIKYINATYVENNITNIPCSVNWNFFLLHNTTAWSISWGETWALKFLGFHNFRINSPNLCTNKKELSPGGRLTLA